MGNIKNNANHILFFELLTGQVPFDGDDPSDVAIMHVKGTLPSPLKLVSNLPKEVEKIFFKATDKDLSKRYKNVKLLRDDILRLYKDKKANQVFEDQTYANYLYNSNKINKKELETHPKKHILLNALGLSSRLSYDIKVLKYSMESILLCSDGLYNSVQLKDIESILRTKDTTKEKVCSLINLANFNGGSDNISCALWEYIND